jgi:ABC-type dipeptide/oligopeptide/nickel transport system permease component
MGESLVLGRSVSSIIGEALLNSAKLALLAFIMVVPVAVIGGVYAALKEGTGRDRLISLGGLSATAVPDFVWAVLLIVMPMRRATDYSSAAKSWLPACRRSSVPKKAWRRMSALNRLAGGVRPSASATLRMWCGAAPQQTPR